MNIWEAKNNKQVFSENSRILIYSIVIDELLFCLGENIEDAIKLDFAKKMNATFDDLTMFEVLFALKLYVSGSISIYEGKRFSFITISKIIFEYRKHKIDVSTPFNLSGQL